ncbi:MAG TPA: hypothetical protein VLI88_00915 [Patescibacteria group bacterium]|nr:hypothetical protein [Patescibacteria group bacterium]
MHKWIVLIALGLTACAPAGTPPSASPSSPSPAVAASATPTPSAGTGNSFTMPTDRDMITFAADRGALIAFSSKDAPPPYESKVQRAEAAGTAWRTIYTSDSHFSAGRVANGRVALAEYREPFQSGGAYSVDFRVVDLSTGTATPVDRFALSSATFRGGGGAPRRPVGSIVLGLDRVAWTRLIEGPGGSVTGELRVALLADPGHATPIGSSAEWIAPLGLDARRLLYVVGGKTEDQLHIRDLDTGADKVIATGAVGDQQREGGIPGFNVAVLAGDWAVWLDRSAVPGKIRAVNVASGADRTIDAGGSSCSGTTAGTRYVAWYCSASVSGIVDARTLEPARDVPVGVAPEASDDALLWFTVVPNGRTVTLFRPR